MPHIAAGTMVVTPTVERVAAVPDAQSACSTPYAEGWWLACEKVLQEIRDRTGDPFLVHRVRSTCTGYTLDLLREFDIPQEFPGMRPDPGDGRTLRKMTIEQVEAYTAAQVPTINPVYWALMVADACAWPKASAAAMDSAAVTDEALARYAASLMLLKGRMTPISGEAFTDLRRLICRVQGVTFPPQEIEIKFYNPDGTSGTKWIAYPIF